MTTDTENFLETLLWDADNPDEKRRPWEDATIHEFHPDFVAAAEKFLAGFRAYLAKHHPDLDPDMCERGFGGNCYFSLSGAGVGFWDDRDMELGDALHAALKEYSINDLRFWELSSNLYRLTWSRRIHLALRTAAFRKERLNKYFGSTRE